MILTCQARYRSPGRSSYRIAVKLGGDKSWGRISDEFVHGRRGSLIKRLINELISDFDLPSPLPLSWAQFFLDRGQTWWGQILGQDLGRVCSWETSLIN